MTLSECIDKFNYLKPHAFDNETLAGWIMDVDKRVYSEIILTHEGAEEGLSSSDELLLPDEYSDIYLHYLGAQTEFFGMDTAGYLNSMLMFNELFSAYADNYNRTHIPKGREVTFL